MTTPSLSALPRLLACIVTDGAAPSLYRVLSALRPQTGLAVVILGAGEAEETLQALARATPIPVQRIQGTTRPHANTIYLTSGVSLEGGALVPSTDAPELFLRALAREQAEQCAVVLLSPRIGSGVGVLDVRDAGGHVFIDPEIFATLEPPLRRSLGESCAVPAEEIPTALLRAFESAQALDVGLALRGGSSPELATLFERLRQVHHLDLTAYKTATLARRIERRMALLRVPNLEGYCEEALRNPGELDALYKSLLIGVTRFFRDPEAFHALRREITRLQDRLSPGEELRVWVPGCATGEEAYSLAMLCAEELEARGLPLSLKIFATDIHRDSLQRAAAGVYHPESIEDVPEPLRMRYFVEEGEVLRVSASLRRLMVFSPHNVIHDPPFTRLDLVSCRNLLIYLQPAAQQKVLRAFYFALKQGGTLFLGPSEGAGALAERLGTVDRQWKIYQKTSDERLPVEVSAPVGRSSELSPRAGTSSFDHVMARVSEQLLSRFVPTGALLDERREVLHFFGEAGRYLRPSAGRASRDILSMAQGELHVALSSAIYSCLRQRQRVSVLGVQATEEGGRAVSLAVRVDPLHDRPTGTLLLLLSLTEERATEPLPVPEARLEINEELRARVIQLEAELQQTRASLQATVEELGASNEKLQVSNEELLASNEELQSTNEELHSVNEELHQFNTAHEQKIRALNEATSDLQNLMQATEIGTIFTDLVYRIRLFTPSAAAIFHVLPQDLGRDLRHINSRVPQDDVFAALEEVNQTQRPQEKRVRTPEGSVYLRRIKPYLDLQGEPAGLILTFVNVTNLSATEDALRASEEQFRNAIESAPEGILMVDEEGLIVHANQQAGLLFGALHGKSAALIGAPLEDLIPEAHRDQHRVFVSAYNANAEQRRMASGRALFARRLDGEIFPVEVSLAPMTLGGRSLAVAFVSDITERTQAEAERNETAHRFRQLTESLPQLIWTCEPTGDCDYLSQQWVEYTGIPEVEQLGASWINQVHPDDRAPLAARWQHSVTTGEPLQVMFRIRRHDGVYRWFDTRAVPLRDTTGAITKWFGLNIDDTERRAAQEQLRVLNAELSERERRFRTMANAAPVLIWISTPEKERVWFNETWLRWTGRTQEEEQGDGWSRSIHPEDREECLRTYHGAFDARRPYVMKYRLRRADGSYGWLYARGIPLFDDNENFLGFIGACTDITQQEALLQERANLDRKLQETARLESLGVLAGGIAHDFNNILTGILGNAAAAAELLREDDPQRPILHEIATAAQRAGELCRQMLAYAGRAPFLVRSLDLGAFVQETTELVRVSVGKRVSLRFWRAPEPLGVHADVAQLRQVLMNLVINASEAIGDAEGQITIQCERVSLGPEELVRRELTHPLLPGEYVCLSVSDTGCGIRPEDLQRIFDPFFTTKFTGRGLGLAATHGIVRSHKGALEIQSTLHRGTIFRLYLPHKEPTERSAPIPLIEGHAAPTDPPAPPPAGATAARHEESAPTHKPVILIIDDEDGVRRTTSRILARAGWDCDTAAHGEEGVALLARDPARYALVLLDVTMPGWDFDRTLQSLRALRPTLPVLVMSGFSEAETLHRFRHYRDLEFLEKPFGAETLRAAVRRTLHREP